VQWPLHVRHPVPGERFRPFGLDGSKTLGDYFTDIGLPVPQRPTRHLVVDAADRVLWVVGHAPSAHAALTRDTTRVVEIAATDEL
jgi:tRNA(Ile)-lysidine synthase